MDALPLFDLALTATEPAATDPATRPPWRPRRLLVTAAALSWPQGAAMAERAAALGAKGCG